MAERPRGYTRYGQGESDDHDQRRIGTRIHGPGETLRYEVMTRFVAGIALGAVVLTPVGRAFTARHSAFTVQSPAPDREAAYRSNNLGVALLEQYQYESAASAFRDAVRIDPSLALAHLNLAIALYYVPDLPGALREATEAA